MCGRVTNRLTWREIVALYRLSVPAQPERNLPGRYNICPTDTIDAVVERDGKRDLVPMRWGLVPWWWKKKVKEMPATFNARAEPIRFNNAGRSASALIFRGLGASNREFLRCVTTAFKMSGRDLRRLATNSPHETSVLPHVASLRQKMLEWRFAFFREPNLRLPAR